MKPRTLVLASTLAVSISLLFSAAHAAPPPEARIDEAIRAYEEVYYGGSTTREALRAAAEKATQGLNLDDLTAVQIGRLMSYWGLIDPIASADAAQDRLETFLDDRGVGGATAAVFTLQRRIQRAEGDEAKLAVYRGTLNHPGLEDAIRAGAISNFFGRIPGVRSAWGEGAKEDLLRLRRLLTPELAPQLATGYRNYFDAISAAFPDRREDVQGLRVKLVALAQGALPQIPERSSKFVSESIDYLSGAHARGELMNNPAPALEITWTSDESVRSLADLKGRVVIVDFWATWCGPCVGSFPKVRELAAHYKDYPVTIIGVTSLQGSHIPGGGQKAIDTRDDPAKEHALMGEYIREMDITWPIVFTRQSCFNGEYGVRGIPHVAIIDPAGNVRHNGLHPGGELADKAAKIDALLKEFNLRTPPPVAPAAKSEAAPQGN